MPGGMRTASLPYDGRYDYQLALVEIETMRSALSDMVFAPPLLRPCLSVYGSDARACLLIPAVTMRELPDRPAPDDLHSCLGVCLPLRAPLSERVRQQRSSVPSRPGSNHAQILGPSRSR